MTKNNKDERSEVRTKPNKLATRAVLTLMPLALMQSSQTESDEKYLIDRTGNVTGKVISGDVYRFDSRAKNGLRYGVESFLDSEKE